MCIHLAIGSIVERTGVLLQAQSRYVPTSGAHVMAPSKYYSCVYTGIYELRRICRDLGSVLLPTPVTTP